MDILGISAFRGPSAACLVRDGRVVAAAREDVFTGLADDERFPSNALAYCLRQAKIGASGLAAVHVAAPLDLRIPTGAYRNVGGAVSSFGGLLGRWLGRGPTLRDALARELDPLPELRSVDPASAEAAAGWVSAPWAEAAILVLGGEELVRAVARDGRVRILGREKRDADMRRHAGRVIEESGIDALVLAGRGARDRMANGALMREGFRRLWMHPASGAGAAALGAALLGPEDAVSAAGAGEAKIPSGIGPSYNAAQIRTFLRSQGVSAPEPGRDEAPRAAASLLAKGAVVGWMDGRLDFGDETAGSRAVFRAPSPARPPVTSADEALAVPAERAAEIFEVDGPCPPRTELVVRDAWRDRLADPVDPARALAVAPVPTEHRTFRVLIAAFESETGCPAVVARPMRRPTGPIACAPHDVWSARDAAALDALALGPYVVTGHPAASAASPVDVSSSSTP